MENEEKFRFNELQIYQERSQLSYETSKLHFYTDIVLYAVAKNLLISKKELCFPDHHDMNSLANELGQYFTTKVETIRSQLRCLLYGGELPG